MIFLLMGIVHIRCKGKAFAERFLLCTC